MGRVSVGVHEAQRSRSLDLHVQLHHGPINLVFPPTKFDGPLVVQAHSLDVAQIHPQ
ncbi:hypothetical protein BD309DRAFT_1015880 [Dichomitus squalens]|nr:hypothetical protein BD309DRAFT_1015880 [Dichomitus squalens]